jgi:predicted  nucleic acid-binding Zn-ribbon protein
MVNPSNALRALQEIDRDIHRVRAELRRLPAEKQRRDAELALRRTEIGLARQRAMELKVRVREIEDTTTTWRQRIRKLEQESNSTRDMAVVEGCRYEIRSLKRQIDDAEREGLEHVEVIEQEEARAKELEELLAAELLVHEEFSRNLEHELQAAGHRLAELEALRKQRMSADLNAEALTLYERLLGAREGEAMAPLESGICQACYMEVPPNLRVRLTRANEVIQCPHCDRILYLA